MKGMRKISRGTGFRGALNYAFNRDGELSGRIIGGNMDGNNPRSLAAEFGRFSRLRRDIEKPVWHNALRLPAGERLEDEKWQEICDEYMLRMGFTETHPRVYVMHDDDDGQHIHIIASRINISGSVYLGKNENLISTRHISALERDFGLKITKGPEYDPKTQKTVMPDLKRPKKGELEKYLKAGAKPPRLVIQQVVSAALKGIPTMAQFLERVESSGVSVIANIASTGKFNGFSFVFDGISFKGSQLGDAFKSSRLLAAINYEPSRDRSLLDARRPLPKPTDEDMAPTVRNPVLDSDQERRDRYKLILIDRHYQADLASKVGPPAWVKSAPDAFVIGLKDGGRLIDRGSRVSAINMSDQTAARRLVEMALAKKWESVNFSGSIEFRRAAYRFAILEGMKPAPSAEDAEMVKKIEKEIAHEQAEANRRIADAARSIDAGNSRSTTEGSGRVGRGPTRPGGTNPHDPRQPVVSVENFGKGALLQTGIDGHTDATRQRGADRRSGEIADGAKTLSGSPKTLSDSAEIIRLQNAENMQGNRSSGPVGLRDWRERNSFDDAGSTAPGGAVEEAGGGVENVEPAGSTVAHRSNDSPKKLRPSKPKDK